MPSERTQPKGLPYLFLTEMWERLGFYVVQGMLVLYMTKAYGFSDEKSFTILGMFTALAYIAPMVGGYLADAFLGFKVAILWGGIFLIVGYAMLAAPFFSLHFYIALATIIIGTGLFKPNISSLLGALYTINDSRRDSGFTIFYIGINIGILLAGVGSGILKEYFGWHASFALASIGLIIGLITFAIGINSGALTYQSEPKFSKNKKRKLNKGLLFLCCILTIGLVSFLLQNLLLGEWLLPAFGILLLIFVFKLALNQGPENRRRLLLLIFLMFSSIVFWMILWQIFFSVNLFIDRLVNRTVFSIRIPTTAFYTLEALFVIVLGAPLAYMWQKLGEKKLNPSPIYKFILAIGFLGVAFLVLACGTFFTDKLNLVNPLWIVVSYFLITIGEMFLSPIGLSAVTLLSPPHLTGMLMGIWFVALGFGGQFAGLLAKLASIPSTNSDALSQLAIYRHAFLVYGLLAFAVAIGLFVTQLILKKMLRHYLL